MESNREPVPYIVHEGILARQERNIKRLWILCIVIFLALVGTNAAWIIYENQYEDIVIKQDADTDPLSYITLNGTGTGNIYGTREPDNTNTGQEE